MMVHCTEDLQLMVDELRTCYAEHKHEADIVDRVKGIIRPWIDQPDWLEPKYLTTQTEEDVHVLYSNGKDDILITVICWRQGEEGVVHDHNTWAVIGVVQGQETHRIWKRTDDRSRDGYAEVEATNRMTLLQGQTIALPVDGIHSVMNDSDLDTTIAIHVYGGDLVELNRRQYFPDENRCEFMHSMK